MREVRKMPRKGAGKTRIIAEITKTPNPPKPEHKTNPSRNKKSDEKSILSNIEPDSKRDPQNREKRTEPAAHPRWALSPRSPPFFQL